MTRALQPRTNGELIDSALRTLRTQFGPLFSVVLVFELVHYAFAKLIELVTLSHFSEFKELILHPDPDHIPLDTGAALTAAAVSVLYLFASFVLWQLAIAALTLPPGTPWAKPALAPLATLQRLVPHLGALVTTLTLEALLLALSILSGLVPLVAGVLAAVTLPNAEGIALMALGVVGGAVVAVGALLMVLLRYVLVPQIVVSEGLRGGAALARSAALMRGKPRQRLWDMPKIRGSILILVVQLVAQSVALVLSAPQALVSLGAHQLGATPGIVLTLLAEALAVIGVTAVAPFGSMVLVGFYFDLRTRREGFDLELMAAELSATS